MLHQLTLLKPNQRIVVLLNNDEPAHAMNNYNEKETILMLQDSSTQRKAFERIVKAYSETAVLADTTHGGFARRCQRLVAEHVHQGLDQPGLFPGRCQAFHVLYRIAFNECLNFLNKQRAENQLSIDDADAALINKLESDPYFNGDENATAFSEGHPATARETAHHLQPEIFPGNENTRTCRKS